MLQLRDLYSTKQADDYLQNVPYGTLKRDIFTKKTLQPIMLGDGQRARTAVFTRRMLDAYNRGDRPVKANLGEARAVLSSYQVMELTGLSRREIASLPHRKMGSLVFLRSDLKNEIRRYKRQESKRAEQAAVESELLGHGL